MSQDGFQIDVDPVRETCSQLKTLRADFDEVHRYAAEADPEDWMWGLTGLTFAWHYMDFADGIRSLLVELGPAMDGLVERIERACDDYEWADERSAGAIDGEAAELTGSAHVR